MSFLDKYIAYLKDNPNRYWFKRKIWGWGWTPATWEGWGVTILVLIGVILNAIEFEKAEAAGMSDTNGFLFKIGIFIFLLILIAWRKGESPKWQWGFPKKDDV